MAQVLVRNVEPEVVERLRNRARRNNRSLEAEVRCILEEASETADLTPSVERIQALFTGRAASDSGAIQAEDREDRER